MLLALDKEHKKLFSDVPVVEFHNGKSLKDYLGSLARAALLKTNENRIVNNVGRKTV